MSSSGQVQHARRRVDLWVTSALSAVAITGAITRAFPAPLSEIVEGLFVLLVPGWVAVAASRPPRTMRPLVTFIAVLAASLCIVVLGGLLLNEIGPGLTRTAWAVYLGAWVLAGTVTAEVRWPRVARGASGLPGPGPRSLLLLSLAGVIAGAGVWVTESSARRQLRRQPGFETLSMLDLAHGRSAPARLAVMVQNETHRTVRLRLRVCRGHQTIDAARFSLPSGASYRTTVRTRPRSPRSLFVATLRRDGSDRIQRFVTITGASRASTAPRSARPPDC